MNEAYASRGQDPTKAAGYMLAAISVLAAILVIAGLFYATGIGARRKALLAVGDCAPVPGLVKTGLDCTTEQQLDSQYTKITTAAVQQLNTDAAAYAANEFRNLGAAEAALTAEVAMEKSLDTSLERFQFPSPVAAIAKALIRDNAALVKLTTQQARSSSLTQVQSLDESVKAASATVETEMKLVGIALAKPPTANVEP